MVGVLMQRRIGVAIIGALLAVGTALLGGASPAGAINDNPGILPPGSHAFGKTYGGWSAAWWQWAIAQPTGSNPQLDTTGQYCAVGQSGPVFFLAGVLSGGTVSRNCVVPAGKALFFPLVNAFNVDCSPPCSSDEAATAWDELENTLGFTVTALSATIDQVPVENLDPVSTPYRACAGPVARCTAPGFNVNLPAQNPFGAPSGNYGPTVADGVYLLLAPLRPGVHTITFGGTGSFNGQPNPQEITYNLVVSSK